MVRVRVSVRYSSGELNVTIWQCARPAMQRYAIIRILTIHTAGCVYSISLC